MKIPVTFFLQFIWKHNQPQIAKAILNIKSNAGIIIIADTKIYYRTTAIKKHGTNKNTHETNRTEYKTQI
jgi:hypothetical protein